MRTAKVLRSGNSQAVRIPAEFQFDADEVGISRRDDGLVLRNAVPGRTFRLSAPV